MKSRFAWYLLVAVLAAVGAWAVQHRRVTRRVSPVAHAEVAIQDGKTIDFSSGKPVVKDDAVEKATIDRSVAAMDAAAAQVSFAPQKPATPDVPAPAEVKR